MVVARKALGLAVLGLVLAGTGCAAAAEEEDAAETAVADGDKPAAEAAAAPAAADDLAGARALVDEIYGSYASDQFSDSGSWFTPGLERLINDPAAGLADPEIGLGYDPLCACQDFGDVGYEIASVDATGPDRAHAEVAFTNFGQTSRIALDLQRVDGRWLVDDVGEAGGPTLRQQAN